MNVSLVLTVLVGCASTPEPSRRYTLIDTQYEDGLAAYNGRHYYRALSIWTELANKGSSEALNSIGMMYQNGRGVSRDVTEAAQLYQAAANTGLAAAQNNLGVLYESGEGVDHNPAKAAELYRKSADQGYVWAQYNLARLFQTGNGVPKDSLSAQRLFEQAEQSKKRIKPDKILDR
ncbi:MAG: ybeQ [Halothiobacillaceae bacterium]|nr:MAG: ybeQ [Halothiobacillaceae bacterium]